MRVASASGVDCASAAFGIVDDRAGAEPVHVFAVDAPGIPRERGEHLLERASAGLYCVAIFCSVSPRLHLY